MITVRLKGGLGNQMFQYACGRRLAHHLKTGLCLDLVFFQGKSVTPRHYELDHFILDSQVTIRRYAFWHKLWEHPYREKSFSFDPQVLSLTNNSYLDGYWQSEKYFSDISSLIVEEFTPQKSLQLKRHPLKKQILNCSAVSVHIRRGDYALHSPTKKYHGLLRESYYQQASEIMHRKGTRPHYFIFTDDPGWAASHLHFLSPRTLVSGITADWEDLSLMSYCSHHIIANSSFSWWGAWLSRGRNELTIAPKRWFRDSTIDTSDLIPSDWLRI